MASSLHFIAVLCLTSGLWTAANAVSASDKVCKTCPPGWTQFEDVCYMYNSAPKDWTDAEVACVALGGNLASVHNDGTFNFLKQIINTATGADDATWIGGQDTTKEGSWLWSDGSAYDWEGAWGSGEPNNTGYVENCIEMNYYDYFNDEPCDRKRPFICNKKL